MLGTGLELCVSIPFCSELADLGASLEDVDLVVEVWEGDKTFLYALRVLLLQL
jgi:hypothetical protein